MEARARLDISRIWREVAAELVTKASPLARVLWLPAVIMAVLEIAISRLDVLSSAPLVIPYLVLGAIFAVSTHRTVLLGRTSVSYPLGMYLDRAVLAYIGYSLLIGFGAGIVYAIGYAVRTVLETYSEPVSPGLIGPIAMIIILVSLVYLTTRFLMVLPAKAVSDRLDLGGAFEASSGNGWRLVAAIWIPSLAVAWAFEPLNWLIADVAAWIGAVLRTVSVLLGGIISVSVVSCAYRDLKRMPGFPVPAGRSSDIADASDST